VSGPDEPGDGLERLGDLLVAGVGAGLDGVGDAVAHVVVEQFQRDARVTDDTCVTTSMQ
jgi:hypothetical protein